MSFLPSLSGSGGALASRRIQSSANTTLLSTDRIVFFDRSTSPAAMTVTLPSSPASTYILQLVDASRNAATYPITVQASAGTVQGNATAVINQNGQVIHLWFNGTEWVIVAGYFPDTAAGLSVTQLTDAGALAGTEVHAVNRGGTDLKATGAAQTVLTRKTPAAPRSIALPATLTATDNDGLVELTGTTGTLDHDGTLPQGAQVRVRNRATGDGTYSTVAGRTILGDLGTTAIASGSRVIVEVGLGGTVHATAPSGGSLTPTLATSFTAAQSLSSAGIGTPILYTLSPPAGTVWPASEVFTPHNGGSAAGAFSPATVTVGTNSSADVHFTFTPTGPGTVAATFTTSSSLTNSTGTLNCSVSSSPFVAVSSVTPVGVGITATASGTFANGAPASLSATMDGASLSIAGISIAPNSGTGSTAAGTWSFTFTNPAAGAHNLVVSGSGTYAGTSSPYSYTTATATLAINSITAPAPSAGFTASGTYANFTPSGLQYSYDSSNGTDGTWTTASSPSISGGTWSFACPGLVAGTYKLWVRSVTYTSVFAGSNTFTVAAAGGTITAPGSSTVNQPAAFPVTESGSGNPTLYASITSGGVEQTPRTTVPWGTTSINMTPTVQAASTASLYAAASGGSALATSGSFTPAAGSTGYGQVQSTDASAWYDFSDGTTLYSDTARTTLQSTSGGAVQGVADKSGNGYHLAQATTGSAPTLALGAQNGKSGLVFVAASSQFLNGNAGSALTTLLANLRAGDSTILIIGKASSGQGGQPLGVLLHASTDDGGVLSVGTHYSNGVLAGIRRNYYLQSAVDAGASGTSSNILVKSVQTYNVGTKVLTSQANAATLATGSGPSGSDTATAWDALKIGRGHGAGGGTPYFDGTIFEIVVWNAQASSAECTALITAMTAKWGS